MINIDASTEEKIEQALLETKRIVLADGNQFEISYLGHLSRYKLTLRRIMQLLPNGGCILDVGSHYLHQSVALRLLGYDVTGMDVSAFSGQPHIKDRSQLYNIDNHIVENFGDGSFLKYYSNKFDLVLFTEIMEHITFNPVRFWLRIYEMMKIGSDIYITTPNSLTPWKMLAILKNLIILRGTGLPVKAILNTVTYGHHWKEYSSKEIKNYFSLLSPDFVVSIAYYDYRPSQPWTPSLQKNAEKISTWFSRLIPPFREELDVVVRLQAKTAWLIDTDRLDY